MNLFGFFRPKPGNEIREYVREDVAGGVFNPDAFVAAQLWDLPARVGVGSAPDGTTAVVASLRFR